MPLEEYQAKRDFERTPEPAGETGSGSGPLRFVIQKHDATRLHYDLRLEADGVLKSWAVPKGPSLDPDERRLAVRTEDHPLSYLDFEEVIPEENYGAGPMIVWDRGTYRVPEVEEREAAERKMRRGLEKGKLSFILEGEKVRGGFHLVQMEDDENWLLIKRKDAFTTEEDLRLQARSVKTGRTLEELLEEERPTPSTSLERLTVDLSEVDLSGAERAPMPADVSPMLATLTDEVFDREGWLFEIKWDGFRALAELREEGVRLYSRTQQGYESEFGLLVRQLERLDVQALLDGEIVVVDEEGRASFRLLQRYRRTGEGTLAYYVFDLLHLAGHDLRPLPLHRRKALLRQILPESLPRIRYSSHVEERGRALFEQAAEAGVEGVIAKDEESPYREGTRSKAWLKFKTRNCQEAVIGGFTAPRGTRHEFGALLLGVYEGDDLIYVGHTGSGFDEETLVEVKAQLDPLVRESSPFRATPKTNAPPTWVKPELVCQVHFASWTDIGLMRQAIFLGLREDMDPHEVVRELPAPPEKQPEPPPRVYTLHRAPKEETTLEIDGREVTVTSLDKVLWPDDGVTKGEMIAYYRDVSRYILPYLVDRPESLHRFPRGIDEQGFYQKDVEHAPDWVRRLPIESESGGGIVDYLLCQDESTLVFMANLNCIDINPWNSRVGRLDYPDYLAIDLDPSDANTFDEVIDVALVVHEILGALDLPHPVKTSGGTGLHIFVPLGAEYTYKQVQQFGFLVAHLVHARRPEITSLERSPKKRRQKIYLDILQNRRGQTMTAPYSLRPRRGAPVSTPLRWEEVQQGLSPLDFTIQNIQERIDEVGDLWRGVLGPGIDMEGALARMQKMWQKATE
jgi:bifunctional non-homologous end joining protein LigD